MKISRRDRAQLQSWLDTKANILVRDRNRCVYCRFQGGVDDENLTVDHIVPLAHGGSRTKPSNLAACCLPCNRIKGDKVPHGIPLKTKNKNGRRPMHEYERIYAELIAPMKGMVVAGAWEWVEP